MNNTLDDMKVKFLGLSAELARLKSEVETKWAEVKNAKEAVYSAEKVMYEAERKHREVCSQRLEVAQKHHALAWQISDLVSGTPNEHSYVGGCENYK